MSVETVSGQVEGELPVDTVSGGVEGELPVDTVPRGEGRAPRGHCITGWRASSPWTLYREG